MWDEPATGKQLHTIAKLCIYHGIEEQLEDRPMTRQGARSLI